MSKVHALQIKLQVREKLLACIMAHGREPFTAEDMSLVAGVTIPTAIGHIMVFIASGHVERYGWKTRFFKPGIRDAVQTYVWTGKTDPCKMQRKPGWEDRKFVEHRA